MKKVLEAAIPLASVLSRRAFCAGSLGACALAMLGGCDAGTATPMPDLSPSPDLTQVTCPASAVNCGDASAIAVDTATHFTDNASYDFYLCRDANGLFSVNAICTHQGCTVNFVSATSGFRCPCHGARYSFTGQNPTTPAPAPLGNWAVCVDSTGAAFVDTTTMVDPSTRV